MGERGSSAWQAGVTMDDSSALVDRRAVSARRLPVLLAGTAGAVLLVDQVTKAWAVAALSDRGPVDIVDGLLRLDLIRNSGAAFSMATGATWVFTVIAVVVSVVIIRISRRLGSTGWAVALGLLLGGAVGNLIDRLARSPGFGLGHVVDFLELPHFPVFNVADSCIVTAAALIALLGLRGVSVDGSVGGG